MNKTFCRALLAAALATFGTPLAFGWDYDGHRTINQLALSALPTNFPALFRDAEEKERFAFLSGEPDRWRNVQDLPIRHRNGPDHYIDCEELQVYGLKPEALPVFRYDFVAQLALLRNAHPERLPKIDPAHNEDHTGELVGMLPWAIVENFGKLKSGFAYLKTYEQDGGTKGEIENAQANIVYAMGVMGHFVADAAQPLHTTIHHHGWVGENPHQYSTNRSIHSLMDGGYLRKVGGVRIKELQARLRPAQAVRLNGHIAKPEEVFQATMAFVMAQNKMVEPLYQMEKEGKFSGDGERGMAGRGFLEDQFLQAAQFLSELYYSAWEQAPPDTFLKGQLGRRKPTVE